MTREFSSGEAFRASDTFKYSGGKGLFETVEVRRRTDMTYGMGNVHTYSPVWSQYALSPLPGCCGVVVSHDSSLKEEFRGKGLGDFFHKERLDLIQDLGYSCALATVQVDNDAEKHILEKNGWLRLHIFKNSRTGNWIEIWCRNTEE